MSERVPIRLHGDLITDGGAAALVESVEKLQVCEGDILLFRYPLKHCDARAFENIRAMVRSIFPDGVKIVFVPVENDLSVLTNEERLRLIDLLVQLGSLEPT